MPYGSDDVWSSGKGHAQSSDRTAPMRPFKAKLLALAAFGKRQSGASAPTAILLNHFNGADASTTFTDQVQGITWTGILNGQLDTAQKQFGSASFYTPSVRDDGVSAVGFTVPATGSWTVECFARGAAGGKLAVALYTADGVTLLARWRKRTSGSIDWLLNYATALDISNDSYNVDFSDNAWRHVAIVRNVSAGTYRLYMNGALVRSETQSDDLAADIGKIKLNQAGEFDQVDGWIDEVRITLSAVYTGATYTVPTAEFT